MTPERDAAIERFYKEYRHQLLARLRGNIKAAGDVHEDALGFAWAQLVQHPEVTLDHSGAGWMFTVARRHALEQIKRREPETGVLDPDVLQGGGDRNPVKVVGDRHQIAEAGRLPERQKQVLVLHAEGYNYEEIAARIGATLRTVDRLMRKARDGAREISKEYGVDVTPQRRKPPERRHEDGPDLDLSL